jgi:hypothetical protein
MSLKKAPEPELELSRGQRDLLKELAAAIEEIRYGSIVITIHDGRVVELSKTERVR